ncbi:MAG: hypothetical protein IJF94_01275 [Eubacterium sp.]|nr:hypothetical protein [Eubacterium sp.]
MTKDDKRVLLIVIIVVSIIGILVIGFLLNANNIKKTTKKCLERKKVLQNDPNISEQACKDILNYYYHSDEVPKAKIYKEDINFIDPFREYIDISLWYEDTERDQYVDYRVYYTFKNMRLYIDRVQFFNEEGEAIEPSEWYNY